MNGRKLKSIRSPHVRISVVAIVAVAMIISVAGRSSFASGSTYNWLQFDGDAQHSGNNTLETSIGTSNVATLTKLFGVTLPAIADGAPAYLTGVTTANGTQDLVFLTTKDGRILALDAHTGAHCLVASVRSRHLQNQSGVHHVLHHVFPRHRPEPPVRLQLRTRRVRAQVRRWHRGREHGERLAGTGHEQGIRRKGLIGPGDRESQRDRPLPVRRQCRIPR